MVHPVIKLCFLSFADHLYATDDREIASCLCEGGGGGGQTGRERVTLKLTATTSIALATFPANQMQGREKKIFFVLR